MRFRGNFNFDKPKTLTKKGAGRGLALGAEHVLQVSRTEVPVDEGTLERSGTASVDRDAMKAAVSYDTPYAVVQHEDQTLSHPGGGKAKYLEDPLNSEGDTVGEIIADSIKGYL